MRIQNTQYHSITQPNFEGRYLNLLTKPSGKFVTPIDLVMEQNTIRKTYHKLWKQLNLPEELKPALVFEKNNFGINLGFSQKRYVIFVNKNVDAFELRLRNKTGKSKEDLRHEIEHVKQIWEVIRLIGAKEYLPDNAPQFVKTMASKIENTFKSTPQTPQEVKKAKKYLSALKNYPDTTSSVEFDPLDFLLPFEYYFNFLERQARKSQKECRLDFLTRVRRTVFEYVKDTLRKPKNS